MVVSARDISARRLGQHFQELAAESRLDAAFAFHAVQDLRKTLRGIGSDLVVRSGDAAEEVGRLVKQGGASHVFFHSRFVAPTKQNYVHGRPEPTFLPPIFFFAPRLQTRSQRLRVSQVCLVLSSASCTLVSTKSSVDETICGAPGQRHAGGLLLYTPTHFERIGHLDHMVISINIVPERDSGHRPLQTRLNIKCNVRSLCFSCLSTKFTVPCTRCASHTSESEPLLLRSDNTTEAAALSNGRPVPPMVSTSALGRPHSSPASTDTTRTGLGTFASSRNGSRETNQHVRPSPRPRHYLQSPTESTLEASRPWRRCSPELAGGWIPIDTNNACSLGSAFSPAHRRCHPYSIVAKVGVRSKRIRVELERMTRVGLGVHFPSASNR